MSLMTLLFRHMCQKSDAKRDAGLTVPTGITALYDLPYGENRKWQILDIYKPENAGDRLPVIVNFHGGGWVYGTKNTYRYYCMSLAEQGFAVVNPTYRLAPGNRFPAAFEDLARVYEYVLHHAEQYGFDTDRIFGIGDSSGASGTAAFALLLTNPGYAAKFPVRAPQGLWLRGTALNCGMYSTEGRRKALRDLLPKGKEDETLDLLNIPKHITADFPPCFLMSARGDFNAGEPQKLIPALEKHGVQYRCEIYGDENDPLGHVFHCDIRNPAAQKANAAELAFFRSLLSD